ncbi:hypothetical protein [Pallidibacillus thermolactis]|uniref:hypothetical protein n=1 Tax=Pallidibacillus thermolactis TaxID=251051 RepID=UPI0021D9C8BF|nr:hypothetical protein [Pallidibacillus thermolactis]MCU9602740.1 hypothetical protein [Pallidibacillus thermolactis subsp. kokeshiiformis]
MRLGSCGSCKEPENQPSLFSSQTEVDLSIPFGVGTETPVLMLSVPTTSNTQSIFINGLVQVQSIIPLGLLSYQYGVRLRIRRNGTLLFTQTLQQGNSITLTLSFTQIGTIPISIVDTNPTLGTNNYTVTLEFFLRSAAGVSVTAQSRSINALVIFNALVI